jgi:hypothetical protein
VNVVTPDSSSVVRLSAYDNLIAHTTLSPVSADPPIRSMVVEGQSGIGKSTFAIFLIRALMDHGVDASDRHILFSTVNDGCIYGWHNGISKVYSYDDAPVFNKNAVWIINQSEHDPFHSAACRKILIVSTDNIHSKQFKSSAGSHLHVVHMPLPTEVEAKAVAATHGIVASDIDLRIRQVGPICRYLAAGDYTEVMEKLDEAIDQCTFQAAIYNSKVVQQGGDRLSNRIFYEGADANFNRINPILGTPYIADIYMKAWRLKRQDSFLQFIASQNAGGMAVEYSKAFEEFGNAALMKGGQFRVRTLHHREFSIPNKLPNIRKLTIPQRRERPCPNNPSFQALNAELLITNDVFLKPIHGNFGAVDSVVIYNQVGPGGTIADLFQLTTNIYHGINSAELDTLIGRIEQLVCPNGVNINYTIRLFFVLPDYKFEEFRRQNYGEALTDKHRRHLEQHVLEVKTKND